LARGRTIEGLIYMEWTPGKSTNASIKFRLSLKNIRFKKFLEQIIDYSIDAHKSLLFI
jgi:hypothetical protein